MKPKQQSAIWPYLGILAFLFVLSLTAPRAWERRGQLQTARLAGESLRSEAQRVREPAEPIAEVESDDVRLDDLEPHLAALPETETDSEPQLPADEPAAEPRDEIVPPAPEFAEEVADALLVPPPAGDVCEEDIIHKEPQYDVAARPALPAPGPAIAARAEEADADDEPEEMPEEPLDPPAEPDVAAVVATSIWPLPRVLLGQLTSLEDEDPSLAWPGKAIALIHELCETDDGYKATADTIDKLRELATGDGSRAAADSPLATEITRARYGLKRWVDIWNAAARLRELPLDGRENRASAEAVLLTMREFDALPRNEQAKSAWRKYLQFDALEKAARGGEDEKRRAAARRVLDRLASRRLSLEQRTFIDEGPLAQLKQQLRSWAAEPVTSERLLAHLEQYEYSRLASDAGAVANDFRGLNWSAPEEAEQLSRQLNTHYRNANVRMAVADPLINRMIPQPGRIDAPVRDRVVNVPVRGASSTFAELSVRLIPDPRRIRVGLEASGVVDSNTISTSGPATFRNRGQSVFLVRKLFVLGPEGLSIFPAIAEAENNYNYLISLETNFDAVPLVGSLVRTIALNQHDEVRPRASRQTAAKVAIRALNQLDSEAEARVAEAGKKLEQQQLGTLRRLGLELVPISLSTTEKRAVARARLATPVQLGAHTPRPRAPSDSWFSLQLHQSALNNGLEQLDLDGRTFEVKQLFAWVGDKLGRPDLADLDELPEDVTVRFADKDAVRLTCEDGRIEITVALAELTHGRKHWHNFQVRTSYAPEADGLAPRFIRDDTIHLDGRSVRGGLEFKLRAIFSKVFSKNRDLRLLGPAVTDDARVADLQITQFDVADGWIALAYSPRRRASRVARQGE